VLSQLSPDYVSSFFALFEGNTDILLKAIIKGKQLPHSEIAHLHDRLIKNQKQVIEEESLAFDNHNFITSLVNNMSNERSEKLFEKVNRIDAGFARVLRKNIFFLADLTQADNILIENIIRQIDRDQLVSYLSFSQPLIKEKFFSGMTSRNRDIFKDELENFIPLKNDEKAQVQDLMLAEIRQIMAMV